MQAFSLVLGQPGFVADPCAGSISGAMKLDAFYQLSIMLMFLLVGLTILAHCRPFEAIVSQRSQVQFSSKTHQHA